jgi:hypothetical protein
MDRQLTRINNDLYGNGRPGLIREFEKLKTEHIEMNKDLARLADSFEKLARRESNREAVQRALSRSLVAASLIVGIFGTIITIVITTR